MEAAGCQSKHYPALFGTFLRGRADDDIAWIGESRRGVCRDGRAYICLSAASIERKCTSGYLLPAGTQRRDSHRPHNWIRFCFFSLKIHLFFCFVHISVQTNNSNSHIHSYTDGGGRPAHWELVWGSNMQTRGIKPATFRLQDAVSTREPQPHLLPFNTRQVCS